MKTVSCTVSSPLQEKLKAMEPLYGQFSVHTLCDALEVSRITFYNYIFRNKKGDILAAKRRAELKTQIQSIYDDSRHMRIPGSVLNYFHFFKLIFQFFFLDVPFLQKGTTLKTWLESSAFSIEKSRIMDVSFTPQPSPKTWSTSWIPFKPALCSPTRNSSSC